MNRAHPPSINISSSSSSDSSSDDDPFLCISPLNSIMAERSRDLGGQDRAGDLQTSCSELSWIHPDVRSKRASARWRDQAALDRLRNGSYKGEPERSFIRFVPCQEDERVCSYDSLSFITFYGYFVKHFSVAPPFSPFEQEVLQKMNVCPTQLTPSAWHFMIAFEMVSVELGCYPTWDVFLFFFSFASQKENGWTHFFQRPGRSIFTNMDTSTKGWKDSYFKISVAQDTRPFWIEENGGFIHPIRWVKRIDPPELRYLNSYQELDQDYILNFLTIAPLDIQFLLCMLFRNCFCYIYVRSPNFLVSDIFILCAAVWRGQRPFPPEMVKIDDAKFERMRAAHSTKKPPQKKKVMKKKATPDRPTSSEFPITPSCECPVEPSRIPVRPPPLQEAIASSEHPASPERPLKRKKKTVQPPSTSSLTEEVHRLGKCPIVDLPNIPDGVDFDSETLDSLNYKGLDLSPFLADRLLFKKDYDKSAEVINKAGGAKFGRMVVSGLARSLTQFLALLPLLSKQEKQLAKFRGVDPEGILSLQSELDRTKGELMAAKDDLQNAQGLISSFEKEKEVLRTAKDAEIAEIKFEMGELKAVADTKESELVILRKELADQKKQICELQSAKEGLQKELTESDSNAYDMFLAGFKEAKTQILYFNAPMPIDVSQLSTHVKMRVDSSDDEDEVGEGLIDGE